MGYRDNLEKSLYAGFIDSSCASLEKYQPALLVNDREKQKKVLTTLLRELKNCDEFLFSVAFVTNSGVQCLLNALQYIDSQGICGKILASQYQNFTEPQALKRLLSFKNIELKVAEEGNLHAKGYIFRKGEQYSLIVGSSNLTQDALSVNQEWNLHVYSTNEGALIQDTLGEYMFSFNNATTVDDLWIEAYSKIYEDSRKKRFTGYGESYVAGPKGTYLPFTYGTRVSPNRMQAEALKGLEALRNEGKDKALLISAAGTGKTYLSAFDLKLFQPKTFLFVVHRENIARAAMRSYKRVFPDTKMGLLTGNIKDPDADFIFSTIQTLSKDNILHQIEPASFDYIVIDEVHRSGAASYQKIIQYFKPKFLLGMSATPERTDGFDIFKTFDYNIAYEIRLAQALGENMLCPFHYYGVSEISVDGRLLDDDSDFNHLVSAERVERIIEAADFYGCDHGRVKGLIFCSRNAEAKELSRQFNERGYRTVALSGENTERDREDAIKKLEANSSYDCLDYIFTVDIFNEGVDIPTVNQIIMLRPTQSAIVFVQQMGRGLRKAQNKEYLVVIDFIGNYANNYLIPIALYGDRSYNKDNIRRLLSEGSSIIPGCSTVDFEEIPRQRIFDALDRANMSKLADLKKDYTLLKYQVGRVPTMMDFIKFGKRDPFLFVKYSKSYFNFVKRVDPDFEATMTKSSMKTLEFVSQELCNGKRVEELLIIRSLIEACSDKSDKSVSKTVSAIDLGSITEKDYGYRPSKETVASAVNSVNGLFLKEQDRNKYQVKPLVEESEGKYLPAKALIEALNDHTFRTFLKDAVDYGIACFSSRYSSEKYIDGLLLHEKYSRKDVCRILNWEKDESSTVYGYRIKHNTCPIFVTYNKKEDISGSTKYEDMFINSHQFSWMTRNRVKLESSEVVKLRGYKETRLRIPLFVKKHDGEGSDFYYMGEVEPFDFKQEKIKDDEKRELPIVNVKFNLLQPVEPKLYEYLTQ